MKRMKLLDFGRIDEKSSFNIRDGGNPIGMIVRYKGDLVTSIQKLSRDW